MKKPCRPFILVLLAAALVTAGCASNKSGSEATAAPQLSTSGAAPSPTGPTIPKGAQWTLFCLTIPGDNHVAQANQLKTDLLKTTPMKDWYVVHQESESILCYGYYRSFRDPKDSKESARAQNDQKAVQNLRDRLGNQPFREAMPMPINAPDPTAPPEWNLANAKGYWSLQIAAYQGSPERKLAAVEAVRDARARGIEAYYFHGPNVSSVCVGAWPEEALRRGDWDGSMSDRPKNIDANQPIIVLGSGAEKLAQQAATVNDARTGQPLKATVVSQEVEVADPTLLAAMRQYPTHVVNGNEELVSYKDPRTGKLIDQAKPSMIVPIPHADLSYLRTAQPQQAAPGPNLLDSNTTEIPGLGKLRSVK
jgi:hypothetical protein